MPPLHLPKRRFRLTKILIWIIPLILSLGLIIFYELIQGWLKCPSEEPIDVVYTWVNGSDENFTNELRKYYFVEKGVATDVSRQRFDDKEELRYSLRSLQKFAPWINHVYIVTNGQVPNWLNLDYEKVTIVTHHEIFNNKSVLPTFSSPAIEQHLHRIPGLSKRFIYFNDDFFLGRPLYKEDFYTTNGGFRIYLAWPVARCARECDWIYVGDSTCDHSCYNEDCQFDWGDCDEKKNYTLELTIQESNHSRFTNLFKKSPKKSLSKQEETRSIDEINEMKRNEKFWLGNLQSERSNVNKSSADMYGASLQHTNRILNLVYENLPRKVPAHAPFMIDIEIMKAHQKKFYKEILATSDRRFRDENDVQFAFAYYYYLYHETVPTNIGEFFDEIDTDGSGLWSKTELRTAATRIHGLPLTESLHRYIYDRFEECSKKFPDLMKYSKELVLECSNLKSLINSVPDRHKFKYELYEAETYVSFIMLKSEVEEIQQEFDVIRHDPKLFICLNDNLDPRRNYENSIVRKMLHDLYTSMFPMYSKFELPPWTLNKFHYHHQYLEAKESLKWTNISRIAFIMISAFIVFISAYYRQCWQQIVKLQRHRKVNIV